MQAGGVFRQSVHRAAVAAALAAALGSSAWAAEGSEPPEPLVEAQIVREPAGALADKTTRAVVVLPAVRAAVSRSVAGLVERRLAGPAGGVGIDLQGRFQSAVVATRGVDGRWRLSCTADDPDATADGSIAFVIETDPSNPPTAAAASAEQTP